LSILLASKEDSEFGGMDAAGNCTKKGVIKEGNFCLEL